MRPTRASHTFLTILTLLVAAAFSPQVAASDQIVVGQPAPEFELPDQDGQLHSLEDYRDRWIVLYFYPKDETPGCTTEACAFRDDIFAYRELNAQILGVSLDDVESHKRFAEHHNLPFPLLADSDGTAAEAYGVKTKLAGRTVAKRQSVIIDPSGNVAKHDEKVNPDTHSAEILADLKLLTAGL